MALSILLARALVEAVEAASVERQELLASAGFDPRRLDVVDGRMELAEYDSLLEHALDLTGDPALGLHMGGASTSSTYNLAAHLVAHASSLREGLEALGRYSRLLSDRRAWNVDEGEGTVRIRYEGMTGSLRCRRARAENTIAGFYKMVQYFVRDARPDCVAFEYPAPPYHDEYTRMFHGMEKFAQPFTGFVIRRELMDATHLNRDEEFHAALQVQAAKRIAKLECAVTYAQRVGDCVVADPDRQDMRSVARVLGMSARSLRRRLTDEGAVYHEVVERALASLATRLLMDERKSIQEIAHHMHFSEASAFCRAFKRWTGSTPRQYQATHGGNGRDIARALAEPRAR